jgi:hypothetical protein
VAPHRRPLFGAIRSGFVPPRRARSRVATAASVSTSAFGSPAPDGLELSPFIQGEASAGMCNASSAVATRQFSTGDTRTVCCTR